MRIAFFVGTFPSLSETFILNQITGLIKRGHKVDIYAWEIGNTEKVHPDIEEYNLLDCTYRVGTTDNKYCRLLKILPIFVQKFYKYPKIFIEALKFFKYGGESRSLTLLYFAGNFLGRRLCYDIIHCHFGQQGIKGVFLRNVGIIKGKIITTFHGNDVNTYPKKYGKDVYRELFSRGDLYTINSKFTGEKAMELGCDADKIIRHPVGLETEKFFFQKRNIKDSNIIKVITVARLVEKKGIEYSIQAVAKILKEHPNLEYQIIGEGILRPSLEKLITDLEITDKVQLLGWKTHDELQKLYADSHIFILSSVTASDGDKEGQGLVLQEAQAMGLPVLSTLHNGIPDGVLDGKSGFLVPERDVDALAEKLNYLVKNPQIWSDMGLAGRKFVEQNYDIGKLNDKLVQVYQNLLKAEEESSL